MQLSLKDKQTIISTFPVTELYYERNIHNKVYQYDLCILIPKGIKYFAWFRQYKGRNICTLLELEQKKEIADITTRSCCFDSSLCAGRGTIVYGTIFTQKRHSFFMIEDLYYFKDINTQPFSQIKKLNIIYQLLKYHIGKLLIPNGGLMFNLPIIDTNYEAIIQKTCPYTPIWIQYRFLKKHGSYLNQRFQPRYNANFQITPMCLPDIYKIHCQGINDTLLEYGYLHIPSYKTSVMMNELFREIKENINLDALEESDDEDEFEDISPSKYVYLEKKYIMKCVYSRRFKRWIPLEVVSNAKISKIQDITNFEKK